jgi:DNA-binding NtrC family response regulator
MLQLAGIKLADLERLAILQTLQQCSSNRTKAARRLGISVRTLQRKLQIWGRTENTAESSLPEQPWMPVRTSS